MESTTTLRVRYAETDAMGIVHHAVFPVWMELGRSDLLREMASPYTEWERRGVMMTVAELRLKYRAPAHFDEMVEVRTRLLEASRRKVTFAYEITCEGRLLVEGESLHIATGPDGHARTIPEDLLKELLATNPQSKLGYT